MNILVLVEDYPDNDGRVALYFAHARNIEYVAQGIGVTVLNFSAEKDYGIDGVQVITIESYVKQKEKWGGLLVAHAANIRHHYKFIKKYGNRFRKFVFFFHGHEVLRCSKVYPKPYSYIKEGSAFSRITKDIYDLFKLNIWRRAFIKYLDKSHFIFVSQWMLDEFVKWVKIPESKLEGHKSIIYNCIGKQFETAKYDEAAEKVYDFVSVRSDLDGSKYCVDIIAKIARDNPELKFCIVGKGGYFKHFEKPDNLELQQRYLTHKDMVELLNKSKCALMPTRTDAQGVMACEMATFGIPLITSDIPVCMEVFEGFENVGFFDNDAKNIDIKNIYGDLVKNMPYKRNSKYFGNNTVEQEIRLLKDLQE